MTDDEWADYEAEIDALREAVGLLSDKARAAVPAGAIEQAANEEIGVFDRGSEDEIRTNNHFVTPQMQAVLAPAALIFRNWNQTYNSLTGRLRIARQKLTEAERDIDPNGRILDGAQNVQTIRVQIRQSPEYTEREGLRRNANANYERLKTFNDGQDAKNRPAWILWIFLLSLGVAEWFVNYESFLNKFIPLVAIASTLIVAAIVAVNSDHVGRHLKQSRSARAANMKLSSGPLWISSGAFLVALALIFWARYSYYAEIYGLGADALTLDTQGVLWEVAGLIAPTLFLNLMIWGVGVIVALAFYEKVPELREEFQKMKTEEAEKLIEKLNKIPVPVLILINKIDQSNQLDLEKTMELWHERIPKAEILPISALRAFNTEVILPKLKDPGAENEELPNMDELLGKWLNDMADLKDVASIHFTGASGDL
jgi:hypothetical protein